MLAAPAGLKQESLRDRQDWTPQGTVDAQPLKKASQRLLVIVPEDQGPGQGWAWYKTPRQLDRLIRHLNPKGEQLVGSGNGFGLANRWHHGRVAASRPAVRVSCLQAGEGGLALRLATSAGCYGHYATSDCMQVSWVGWQLLFLLFHGMGESGGGSGGH